MITKNFKNICATMLLMLGQSYYGFLPVKGTNGKTYYGAGMYSSFPRAQSNGYVISATTAGIVLGTGTTAATEDDYKIETPIASGLSCTPTYTRGLDNGNPYLEFTLVINNTASTDITVTEIAYNQQVQVATTQGGTSMSAQVICFDHTVFDSPVTIPAGGQNTILYRLKTVVA